MAGGLDLFMLLQVRAPTAADEATAHPTHHCLVLCFFALLYVCLRGGVALGVRSCFGRAVLFPFGGRVPLELDVLSHLRRAALAPCCPTACAPEK